MSINKAIEVAFNQLPENFGVLQLVKLVRSIAERPYVTDGTITRQLRALKQKGKINYSVTNIKKGLYKKKV